MTLRDRLTRLWMTLLVVASVPGIGASPAWAQAAGVTSIPVAPGARTVAADPDTGLLYVVSRFESSGINDTVSVVDGRPSSPTYQQVIASILLANPAPANAILGFVVPGAVVNPTTKRLYVSQGWRANLATPDPETGSTTESKTVIAVVDLDPLSPRFNSQVDALQGCGGNMGALALDPTTGRLFATSPDTVGDGWGIVELDVTSQPGMCVVTGHVRQYWYHLGIALDPVLRLLTVPKLSADPDYIVNVVDVASASGDPAQFANTLVQTEAGVPGYYGPYSMPAYAAADPAAGRSFVSTYGGNIVVIDGATRQIVDRTSYDPNDPAACAPRMGPLTFDPATRRLIVQVAGDCTGVGASEEIRVFDSDTLQVLNGIPSPGTQAGHTVVVNPADGLAYAVDQHGVLNAVNLRAQVLVFQPPATLRPGDVRMLTARSSTALPVTFELVSGPATLAGDVLTATGSGTVVVRASQPADANHDAASVDRAIAVARGTVSINVAPRIYTFGDGQAHVVTYGVSTSDGGTVPAGSIQVTYNGNPTPPANAGIYTAVVSFGGNDRYDPASATTTVTVQQAAIQVIGTGFSGTYDGAPHPGSAIARSAVTGQSVAGAFSTTYTPGGTSAPVNVGTYTMTAVFTSSDPNYVNGSGQATITISRATATMSVVGGSFAYDGAPHPATVSIVGVGGAQLAPTTVTYNGSTAIPIAPGRYTASASFSSPNYFSVSGSATVTITFPPSQGVGSFSVLHSFSGAEGTQPGAPLVEARDGNLYGTTYGGAIFRVSPSGAVTTFSRILDGSAGPLTQGPVGDDRLYGTSVYSVFAFDYSTGVVTTLHTFDWFYDFYLAGGLTLGHDGLLYGTTAEGGTFGGGTVFRIGRDGTNFAVLHSFPSGSVPFTGLVEGSDGVFFGTLSGTNQVFQLRVSDCVPTHTAACATTVHTFTGADGLGPTSSLAFGGDGRLYGLTYEGGASRLGVLYAIDPRVVPPAFSVERSFSGAEGSRPNEWGGRTPDGTLFGTSFGSGIGGTLFKMDSSGQLSFITAFGASTPDPVGPIGGVTQARDGALYGVTMDGGASGGGVVYRLTGPATLNVSAAAGTSGGTANLSARVSSFGRPVQGRTVTFRLFGANAGSAITDANGLAVVAASLFGIAPGSYVGAVTALFGGDGFYAATTASADLAVSSSLSIQAAPASGTYGGTVALAATVTSGGTGAPGLAVTWRLNGVTVGTSTTDASGVSQLSASLAGIAAGSYPTGVQVVFAGNASYPAASATAALVVDKAPATLTLGNLNQTADGTPKAVLVTTTPAGLSGVTVTYAGSATPPSAAGSYAVVASLANANYVAANASDLLVLAAATATSVGSGNVAVSSVVSSTTIDVTFTHVTTAGTTSVQPIDPAVAGTVPGGFQISGSSLAFEITTTASFSQAIETCFVLTSITSQTTFNALRILHREAVTANPTTYALVDRTVLNGVDAPNFATRRICAQTSSLSPFVIAMVTDLVAPSVSVPTLSQNPSPVGTPLTIAATVSDSGTGDSTVTLAEYSTDGGVTWQPMSGGYFSGSTVNASAIITPPTGVYAICVRGRDAAQNSSMACGPLLAVYDPQGGFVTGGGWIMSPPGAYLANPSLTGKASFGFVSKYLKGATVPSGDTQFTFQAAGLTFRSTSYEWLVVAGARAQFKGVGTLNGAAGYEFLLTAIDGDLRGSGGDAFRIKITTPAGALVYDNKVGSADTSDDATALGGGSILIHN